MATCALALRIGFRYILVNERTDLLRYAIRHLETTQMVWNTKEEILYLRKIELIKARLLMLTNQLHRNFV